MENLLRHQKTPCFFQYECQFCQEEGLHFKTEKEARKHFLFSPRSRQDDKRSIYVYSCLNYEKEKRRRAEEDRQRLADKNLEEMAKWRRKWMEMSEEWKEKERRLLRVEKIEQIRTMISQVFEDRSDEFKAARLKEQTEKIDNDPSRCYIFDDDHMIDLMKKKYGKDFLNYVSGELVDKRKVIKERPLPAFSPRSFKQVKHTLSKPNKPIDKSQEKPKSSIGWMCNFCDPEPEFATSQLLMNHIEAAHPEIEHYDCHWD